jgi:hypothetical protein
MIRTIVIWYMVQRVEVILREQRTEGKRSTSALGVEDEGNDQAINSVSIRDLSQSSMLDNTHIDPGLHRK